MKDTIEKIVSKYGLLKIDDEKGGYFIKDLSGNELFHLYGNGQVTCKIGNGDIVLKSDGTYVSYIDGIANGTYVLIDDGNITCIDELGYGLMYDCLNREFYDANEEKSRKKFIYNSEHESEIIIGGKREITRNLNHIEYDEDGYHKLMTDLISIGQNTTSAIESACSAVDSVLSSIKPEPFTGGDTSAIKSSANEAINDINTLNENINYSLLAYDGCDSSLKEDIDKIIDNLFEGNDMGYRFKKYIGSTIEDRNNDGIYEYKMSTDFSSLGENIVKEIKYSSLFLNNISKIVDEQNFNYDALGLTKEDLINDLTYTCLERGYNYTRYLMNTLKNNYPDNYSEYRFNPSSTIHGSDYYELDKETLGDIYVQSELVNVNGFDIELVQVLPKDYTKTEMLAYNIDKAFVINTLKTLPDNYLECIENNTNNAVLLTWDCNTQEHNNKNGKKWGGYYSKGLIVVDAKGMLRNVIYYGRDVVIHELAHKYDDTINGINLDSRLFSKHEGFTKWNEYRKTYGHILPDLVKGSYDADDFSQEKYVSEFYAEAVLAYFVAPDGLKRFCPDVYDELYETFGGEKLNRSL